MLILSACDNKPKPEQEVSQSSPKVVVEKTTNQSQTVDQCVLNMGWDPWAPYQYLTPDNEVRGLEIDLVTAIAKGANCEIKYVQKSWMELLHGIRAGNIDLVAGASKTPAREKFAHFSDDYRHESFVIYIRSGESGKFNDKKLKPLLEEGFRLGVTEDYIYGDLVSGLQDDPKFSKNFVYVPMTEVNYYNLLHNKTDGFLEDPFVAAYTIKSKGLNEQIEAYPIEIHSGDVAIMFSKRSVDEKIVEAFNQSLQALRASGEYNKILAKYSH
jgi:polar amino acid transport system substrate-binding protein